MALTRKFKDTIKARIQNEPDFGEALFAEAINALLENDIKTGKAILRDYINATIGFETLASQTGKSSKSLMRMFSVEGNPNADNLFAVISQLQKTTGNRLLVSASH